MTTAVSLRDARRDEVPAIVAMLADDALGAGRERSETPLPASYYAAFDAIAADANNRLLVAEADGELVGSLQLTFIPGLSHMGAERAQIEAVRVRSDRRGSGIGQQMITAAIVIVRERGCQTVQLTSSNSRTAAQRFYARLGFVASHVGMKLTLT
jgi:ribosomal protein S18 acetylase RimI-like enzyme